jgi:hypothetical protein
MDEFKRNLLKNIGIGGTRCVCCFDLFGRKKPIGRRLSRHRLKSHDQHEWSTVDDEDIDDAHTFIKAKTIAEQIQEEEEERKAQDEYYESLYNDVYNEPMITGMMTSFPTSLIAAVG